MSFYLSYRMADDKIHVRPSVCIRPFVPSNIHQENVQYLKAFKCMFYRNYVSHVRARLCAIRYVCTKIFPSVVQRIGRYNTPV